MHARPPARRVRGGGHDIRRRGQRERDNQGGRRREGRRIPLLGAGGGGALRRADHEGFRPRLEEQACREGGVRDLRPPRVEVIGVTGIPIVKPGDDVPRLIVEAAERQGTPIQDGDIVVVSHIIVSRAEGRIVNLNAVKPSKFAENIAETLGKDPRLVEVILRESRSIVRMGDGHLITETKHGFVCANSGVDQSNVPGEGFVALLPEDPDESARRIRDGIEKLTGRRGAVVVSDTHGRPLRDGEINVTIGVSGLKPIRDRRG
ncbi:MAG TPA: coenzyme F420-0:L-glutamate ligase, partial [Candidatus Bathyarchaeota archaeon]|nr:coenzyme F420-0:L-glutamate ligase [Candidatus Bathyarchaeota archaeon]